jgi:hypothetical protein
VLSPPAALLPLVDTGLRKGNACSKDLRRETAAEFSPPNEGSSRRGNPVVQGASRGPHVLEATRERNEAFSDRVMTSETKRGPSSGCLGAQSGAPRQLRRTPAFVNA